MRSVGIPIRIAGASFGNVNYLFNLAICLQKFGSGWSPVLISADASLPQSFRSLAEDAGIRVEASESLARKPSVSRFFQALAYKDWGASRECARLGIDCLFENATFYGRAISTPVLHWIPDIQHRELPQMFSFGGRLRREVLIRTALSAERKLLLSSYSALDEMKKWYAVKPSHVRVAQFASALIALETDSGSDQDLNRLGIRAPFVFVPNQFWRHKNHLLLPGAARELRRRGLSVQFVCTGNQDDPRNPSHRMTFERRVRENEVEDAILSLGVVPYTTVRALHRRALALVNPSFCEGWNTGVEEAKFFGSRVLASRISSHAEQLREYRFGRLFDPRDEQELVEAIVEAIELGPTSEAERSWAAAEYEKNVRRFVSSIEEAFDDAAGSIPRF